MSWEHAIEIALVALALWKAYRAGARLQNVEADVAALRQQATVKRRELSSPWR
jgi:hypothetical protein